MEPVLALKNIYKDYADLKVLKGVSLSVEKGEVIVLIGPSGCGKSTLLRCINGLEEINSGEIYLDGRLISNTRENLINVRKKVGMVFQSYDLFPHMKVMDNILLGPMKAQKRDKKEVSCQAEALLARVGLADKMRSYPSQLSGGQKQRVAIVRALCMNPEVILFDEITAALDPEMVFEVLEVVQQLADDGLTMVIVTHEMNFAKAVADRTMFMDNGLIVEEGIGVGFYESPQTERAHKFLNKFKF